RCAGRARRPAPGTVRRPLRQSPASRGRRVVGRRTDAMTRHRAIARMQPCATACVMIASLVLLFKNASAAQQAPRFDVLLTNGRIVDGTGAPWFRGDVGIVDDRIAAIGVLGGTSSAAQTIDASNLVVAPGFIDLLGQSEFNVLVDGRAASKIMQG